MPSCTPDDLAELSKCLGGLTPAQQSSTQIALLCLIQNGGTLLSDSFDRANDATSLGEADIGGPYTVSTGTWGIVSNQAFSSSAQTQAVLNAGASDVTAQVRIATVSSGCPGLVFRYSDPLNYWIVFAIFGTWNLRRVVAGVITDTAIGGVSANGDTIKVNLVGTSIKVFRNNVQVGATIVNAFNVNATWFGLGMTTASVVARWDSFLVTSP